MPIAIAMDIDDEFTSGQQPEMIHGNCLMTEVLSLPEVAEEEQEFSKADFEYALEKTSRKIKK
jgi:hypothetical protein